MTLRVLLADDEAIARRRLVRFLRAESDVNIVAECNGGNEALAALEVHALDYLLKPVTAERFHSAFARARNRIERSMSSQRGDRLAALLAQVLAQDASLSAAEAIAPPPPRHADWLTVKFDGRVTFVKTSDVDWIQADGNYVRVHAGPVSHLIRETLGAVEAMLDPDAFSRIHRSTIVNLDRIRELQPWFAGDYVVILKDGTQLKLSRTYREHLQTRLRTEL